MHNRLLLLGILALIPAATGAQSSGATVVKTVKVTVLSTMLVGGAGASGIGEWGFAAVVDADGRRILIDTGARAETVLKNVAELKVDLSDITDVVLTHNHGDHTGGLLALRREFMKKNPRALSVVHVPRGIFLSRRSASGVETNGLTPIRAEYEGTGGKFVEHAEPFALAPGVWLLGPVPRINPERNFGGLGGSSLLQTPAGSVEDNVPEDTAVVVNTPSGLVVISGCGHAGIINTLEYARKAIRDVPVEAAIGGFHLFGATDAVLQWTGERLRALGVSHLLGAHCTGIEAVFRLRQVAGLARATAVVGAVGSAFTLGKGIESPPLAR
ncbi:MAG TPA: MBL fold metallo-hydrolase [Vicinamibacterales bacterium]|nr:MBL fold metallo-hydrolase [Vicinamibacterales bacterium]